MNIKNTLIVTTLTSSMIYGMPSYLAREAEEAECAIINLPKQVSEEQIQSTQEKIENCLKKLKGYSEGNYDMETEAKILNLELDAQFLKECKNVLLGNEDLDSEVAKKWINTAYTYECYLVHFRR